MNEAESRPGEAPVAVVSHRIWVDELGGGELAGRTLTVGDVRYDVVGVLRASFHYLGYRADLWLPLSHVFGKILLILPLQIGFSTAVDGRIDRIVDNLAVFKPTFMGAAPRIFEKAYARISMMFEHDRQRHRPTRNRRRRGRFRHLRASAGQRRDGRLRPAVDGRTGRDRRRTAEHPLATGRGDGCHGDDPAAERRGLAAMPPLARVWVASVGGVASLLSVVDSDRRIWVNARAFDQVTLCRSGGVPAIERRTGPPTVLTRQREPVDVGGAVE